MVQFACQRLRKRKIPDCRALFHGFTEQNWNEFVVIVCGLARNLPRCAKLRGRADENESKTVTMVVVQE